jgi:type IV secretory pathway VirB10-like protein
VAAVAAATALAGAAEEKFSQALPAGDFSAAGLGKLSPEEIARLDALIRDYKSGALEAARREATAAAEARAKAEAKVARAEREAAEAKAQAEAQAARARAKEAAEKKDDTSLLARARVLLTPGTKIDYATVESRIAGEFRGWSGKTIFALENGQRWRSAGESTYVSPPIASPAVKITPGSLGAFWLTVEGVRQRVKVAIVEGAK